ncbi:hypothetical protein BXA19_02420 [Corynebacterium diphtheriae]|nr:hypothetical protein BGK40_06070 [Corynebacterium diphtheriae]OLN13558.1 hypothetical protein BUE62_04895 [Corynebacterium diphtheriae]ONF71238.1 hypothetical protein BXA19_02420 [Corynebacterium diphtheriae]
MLLVVIDYAYNPHFIRYCDTLTDEVGIFIARLTPMAQEQFAGPEYFTDFDPKAFAEKIKKEAALRQQNETNALDEADSPEQQ